MSYTLESLEVYNRAEAYSDKIWNIVNTWDVFTKTTIGRQLVTACDSISANIAEGYGRFYYKESKQFYFYARGSLQETKSWLSKCKRRLLVQEAICDELIKEGDTLLMMLNAFIRFVSKSQSQPAKSQ